MALYLTDFHSFNIVIISRKSCWKNLDYFRQADTQHFQQGYESDYLFSNRILEGGGGVIGKLREYDTVSIHSSC